MYKGLIAYVKAQSRYNSITYNKVMNLYHFYVLKILPHNKIHE